MRVALPTRKLAHLAQLIFCVCLALGVAATLWTFAPKPKGVSNKFMPVLKEEAPSHNDMRKMETGFNAMKEKLEQSVDVRWVRYNDNEMINDAIFSVEFRCFR